MAAPRPPARNTTWVIGPVGKNFTLTMLRLHRERGARWFDVAVAVGELAQDLVLLQQPAPVNPLTTAEYPLPAQRQLLEGVA